ncbi:OmpA family protein [Pseudoroseicyclus aestuarii]|uniref:Outer membrane protein OmpA-like peptidoglycan-associated protein n=1 Tax=Pseudoroseicyclus aestuarii TaxID=1795041 RepID=A0A318STW0_9RHOB|nr:OmpA family protein [Pseudoroseicyclus aestuarii]PYE83809.1 outer membrane protein OmpA-like peptidoglycan-associated protein [Pseudoroseicyclus aestuarii]
MIAFKTPLALVTASALGLAACTPVQPTANNPDPNSNARRGALVGAGLGAAVGALTGDDSSERLRNAAIGAAVAGGVGAAAGNRLDQQEAELRNQLGNNVGIVNNGEQLVVTLPQDILFATDSATLTGSLTSDLRTIATSINNYPNTTVNVIGHTDGDGSAAYNLDLSQRRAQSVANVLTGAGVTPSRIRVIGRGEDQAIASNLTPEGKRQNRRVEIIITPNA